MAYELYYWPTIQGRGEFIRLALEEAGADYRDIARLPERKGQGMPAMLACLDGDSTPHAAYAPPVLRDGDLLIGQTTNILLYLGRRLGLAPRAESGRLWLNQLQLTMADWLTEVHDTHHPLSMNQYYDEQKQAALQRSADFRATRLPKFLDYFTQVLLNNRSRGHYLVGARLTLWRPVAVPDAGWPALCVSASHGAPGARVSRLFATARRRGGAAEHCPLSAVEAQNCIQ